MKLERILVQSCIVDVKKKAADRMLLQPAAALRRALWTRHALRYMREVNACGGSNSGGRC